MDKKKHFWIGVVIPIVILAAFLLISDRQMYGWDKFIAIAVGVAVGAAKEVIWDKWLGRGTPEFYDFVATMIGVFVGTFGWIIAETIIFAL
jgi:hypothetical protein